MDVFDIIGMVFYGIFACFRWLFRHSPFNYYGANYWIRKKIGVEFASGLLTTLILSIIISALVGNAAELDPITDTILGLLIIAPSIVYPVLAFLSNRNIDERDAICRDAEVHITGLKNRIADCDEKIRMSSKKEIDFSQELTEKIEVRNYVSRLVFFFAALDKAGFQKQPIGGILQTIDNDISEIQRKIEREVEFRQSQYTVIEQLQDEIDEQKNTLSWYGVETS